MQGAEEAKAGYEAHHLSLAPWMGID